MNLHAIPPEQWIFHMPENIKKAICKLREYGWTSFVVITRPSIRYYPEQFILSVASRAGGSNFDVGYTYWSEVHSTHTGVCNIDSLDVRIEYE